MNFQTLLSEVQAHLYKPRTTDELKKIAKRDKYYEGTRQSDEVLGDVLNHLSQKDLVETEMINNKTYLNLKW